MLSGNYCATSVSAYKCVTQSDNHGTPSRRSFIYSHVSCNQSQLTTNLFSLDSSEGPRTKSPPSPHTSSQVGRRKHTTSSKFLACNIFSPSPCFSSSSPVHVLDLRCGQGRHTSNLARRFPSVQFMGVDYSTYLISIAQGRPQETLEGKETRTCNTEFQVGDVPPYLRRRWEVWSGDFIGHSIRLDMDHSMVICKCCANCVVS
ncbi:hypothetical protein BDW75DRAFT_57401 [Aspergillus navahoensis]